MDTLFSKLICLFLFITSFACTAAERITIGAGVWALFDNQDISALHLSYESQGVAELYDIQPGLLWISAEGGESYFAFGVTKRFEISDHFNWGIGSNIGFMDHSDVLGHKIEFYTRLLFEYEVSERSVVSLEVGHISNAGFGDINPGSESLVLSYSQRL